MRTHLAGAAAAAARAVSRRAPWHSLWLESSSLVIIAFVLPPPAAGPSPPRPAPAPTSAGTGATTNLRPASRSSIADRSDARSLASPSAGDSPALARLFSSSSTVTNHRVPSSPVTAQ